MRTTLKVISCLLLLFVLGISCSEDKEERITDDSQIQKPLNPNGDSELALLMRAMEEEAKQIKEQIANDYPITINLEHEKILTAEATEPDKAASDEYKAYATAYLAAIKGLKTASKAQQLDAYEHLVGNCTTCHQALCPGPLVRIEKL